MKTIEELYNDVMASDELKKEFLALKPEEVESFAEKYGCKASFDEVKAFLAEKSKTFGELTDSEIEQAAGGKAAHMDEGVISAISCGIACAIYAVVSAAGSNCGTAIEGDRMLCDI